MVRFVVRVLGNRRFFFIAAIQRNALVFELCLDHSTLQGRSRLVLCSRVRLDDSYLVDPASSHMLVSKIKPCMSKYKLLYTVKLRMAH